MLQYQIKENDHSYCRVWYLQCNVFEIAIDIFFHRARMRMLNCVREWSAMEVASERRTKNSERTYPNPATTFWVKVTLTAESVQRHYYRVGSHLNFQTVENETLRSVPKLSGTYRSSFDVKPISSMTSEDFSEVY